MKKKQYAIIFLAVVMLLTCCVLTSRVKAATEEVCSTATVQEKNSGKLQRDIVESETNTGSGRPVTSIEISTLPNKTVYQLGEALNTDGLTLEVKRGSNKTEIVSSGFTVSGFDSTSVGTKTITVTYEKKTATFTVTVEGKTSVAIVSQPQSITVKVGGSATFSIAATGSGLTYQWQYRNAGATDWSNTTLSGNKTKTLTVANVTSGHHGRQYRCVVKDSAGKTVDSQPATLQILYLKKDSATAFGVPVNTDHVFSVEFSVTEGVTYQWQYKGNTSGSTWANTGMTGNKTPNLTVKALSTRNGYSYRCVIKVAGEQIISKAAILYVAAGMPTVVTNPKPATAVCGDYATFKIEAQGEGALYHWQWYHEGTDTWVSTYIAGYHTPELKVKTNNYNDGRLYRCRIRTVNGSGWNEVYTEPAILTVLPAAEVSQQPKNVTVRAGENAQFHIVAEGEGLTYQWQWAKFVGNWKNTTAEGATTEGVVISNVSSEMNGRYYRVIITNKYGGTYTTDYAQLFVEE